MPSQKSAIRTAPVLFDGNVPGAQREALNLVGHALDNLAYFVECFESALLLFDKCEQAKKIGSKSTRGNWRNWQFVAARDGAISIYNFSEAISSVKLSLHECPYLKFRLNNSRITAAQRQFKCDFPYAVTLRHSVSHAGEKAANSSQHAKHGYTGRFRILPGTVVSVKQYVAIDVLNGRHYSNTWNKRVVSYRISAANLTRLIAVRDQIWDAFDEMNSIHKGE